VSYDVIPDRCEHCGGLRRPASFEQAICRCGKASYAGRFYPAKSDSADAAHWPVASVRHPQPSGEQARAREYVFRTASREAT
jgi:hypothetical protein